MGFFSCVHPAAYLKVARESTAAPAKEPDFEIVTYHFICACGVEVDIKHARLTCTAREFLSGAKP